MQVFYAKSFYRAYRKLPIQDQQRVSAALEIFLVNPFDARLHNHKLAGAKYDLRSLSAGYDLRILYEERNGHAVVIMINAGTHDEVY